MVILLGLILALLLAVLALQIALLIRGKNTDNTALFENLEKSLEKLERSIRDEIGRNREENAGTAQKAREELSATLKAVGDSLNKQISGLTLSTEQRLDTVRQAVEQRLLAIQEDNGKRLELARQQSVEAAGKVRDDVTTALKAFNESLATRVTDLTAVQKSQLNQLQELLGKLTQSNEGKIDALRVTVEERLKSLQTDNALKLDQMRATVDEKLQSTLEKRLGESFKQVSDRLEQVHKGLGEMQTLAGSVGDLKRVMTNVKTRGTWGEVLVENLLSQILSPGQFEKNFKPRESSGEVVEFAIKLPGRAEDGQESVWLPIDSKFPKEDYEALGNAQDHADVAAMEAAGRSLENRIKLFAQEISGKYLNPPRTTDFGIMFLPSEGLYAEVIRRVALVDQIQRDYRVVIAGPATLAALLNSLQMGFRTLAIQQRSSEVWKVLGAVKTEFGKFGDLLDGVKKKLDQASNTMEDAARKSRTIAGKLRSVQELPANEAATLLNLDAPENAEPAE
jgi:DNA recombination protein RmuC